MAAVEQLITDNLGVWSSAIQAKSSAGRGKGNKLELYGIKKLRELILELAVRGLLVPQDPKDEPASQLLEKIAAEKVQLVKDGKLKKQKPLPPIEEDEQPFDLPEGWKWTRLREVGHDWGQKKPDKKFTYIDVGSINKELGLIEDPSILQADDAPSRARKIVKNGTVIYSTVRPYLLNIAVLDRDFESDPIASTAFAIIHPFGGTSASYIYRYLRSPVFVQYVESVQTGIAYPAINDKLFFSGVIPLPPTAEQHRIVAKVDELMALCDQLEQQQETSITAHQTLVQTLLGTLTTASEREGFTAAWARIAEHFDALFTTEWSIDQLKQTILQLAVMGKLVPQDPSEEPASELLKKIAAEKTQLMEDGKIKKQKALPPIEEDEMPFELPEGWEWCHIWDVAHTITSGSRDWAKYYSDSGAIFVTMGNLSRGSYQLRLDIIRYVNPPPDGEGSRTRLEENDLLISITGDVGNLGLIPANFGEAYINQHTALLRFMPECQDRYFPELMRTPLAKYQFDAPQRGVKNSFRLGDVGEMVIPVAPARERLRIVAKLDEFMALVDDLKQKLLRRDQIAVAFADAAVLAFADDQIMEAGAMKKSPPSQKAGQDNGRARMPSKIQKFVLRRFRISTGYRSLPDTECEFHADNELPEEPEPVCLVGLNGSGKSNLIEAAADVFCYLEMINLPWKSLRSASSKYRKNDHHFELEYIASTAEAAKHVLIKKAKKVGAEFFIIDEEGRETKVEDSEERLALLPRRIIGYSSGLNETVSHPFLRTRTLYSEEVREAAPPVGSDLSLSKAVFDTNTLYMDYENNAEILLCNYIFRNSGELAFINEFTRVEGVSSFELKFNRKIAGKGSDNVARITDELDTYLQKFASCAGQSYEPDQLEHRFRFKLTDNVKKKFREEFETAENLFLAMYKWSLLNALVLSKEQRNVFLKEDVTTGTLERPPVVAPKDRLFDVADVKVKLSQPKKVIDYSGLSDGEHQFIQVFGTVLLFNQPGSLFLLDEPESHFNPEWRTKFNSIINGIPNASTHEFVISTHSPYLVSGSRGSNVYKFTRIGSEVDCQPIDFETYGASFDVLLNKLFSIDSLIDESAREEMQSILQRGDLEEMEEAVENFAESREKRRLYEAIIKKQSEKA